MCERRSGVPAFWGKIQETAGGVLEVRLGSARGPSEFSIFFGIFLVKLGAELLAAAEQHPTAFLPYSCVDTSACLVLRFCGSGNWLLLVRVWILTRPKQRVKGTKK